jgi:hypothetical protein
MGTWLILPGQAMSSVPVKIDTDNRLIIDALARLF